MAPLLALLAFVCGSTSAVYEIEDVFALDVQLGIGESAGSSTWPDGKSCTGAEE